LAPSDDLLEAFTGRLKDRVVVGIGLPTAHNAVDIDRVKLCDARSSASLVRCDQRRPAPAEYVKHDTIAGSNVLDGISES
jgi:hypothetical protein